LNPFKEKSVGAFITDVLAIKSEDDARAFFDVYVEYLRGELNEPSEAVDTARKNIGWCFGEGMAPEMRAMWRDACMAYHPVFGGMRRKPGPQEAFEAGVRLGSLHGDLETHLKKVRRTFDPPTSWERISEEDGPDET